MRAVQLHQEYALKSHETAQQRSRQLGETFATYASRANELAGHARAKSEELWQAFTQAARAAAVGDDAFVRTAAAYQELQREFAKLQSEYNRSLSEAYSAFTNSAGSTDATLRLKLIDDYIAYLQELRAEIARASTTDDQSGRG
jgi:predicted  nucleic acid-binding Zn-ribbon protein